MPGSLLAQETGDKKRKRSTVDGRESKTVKSRKAPKIGIDESFQAQILVWEEEFQGSQQEYAGNIERLQAVITDQSAKSDDAVLAAVVLCRIFCRLIALEQLSKSDDNTELSLRQQLRLFTGAIGEWVGSPDTAKESAAVTLLMQKVKVEVAQESQSAEQSWRDLSSTFNTLLNLLLENEDAESARELFVEKYVDEYDDIRFYTFRTIKQIFADRSFETEVRVSNAIDILSQIECNSDSTAQPSVWFGRTPLKTKKQSILSNATHEKMAQDAWLACFKSHLTEEHRKTLLNVMHDSIMPWFATNLEVLTDFLTDSFNASGNAALIALEGIFHLMTQRNIDYPDFYWKLYSLLDRDLLHSKRRSRFLQLLEKCLASSHLPAALVASFIKRLARLSLQAPPGAIVWVIPWIYNTLRRHPTCTFMLHREENPAHVIFSIYPEHDVTGMDDPFDMAEKDPMLTKAIDSSLWEAQTLATHYHPNVATLASILGEQFTKRDYHLDDFLDHSYSSLLSGDLERELKKTPAVEWEIPKRIITADGEQGALNSLGQVLQSAISAS